MKIRGFAALAALAVCAPPAIFACGSNANNSGVAAAKLPEGMRSESLDHEQCNESGNRVEQLDTNNDGKPDIRRVFDKSGHELCRVVDLNHDGKPDLYEYFDPNGNVRRREFCYDDTGVVNAIEYYDSGKLSRREYDTTGQHKIDTWDYFDGSAPLDAKTGRPTHPVRRERDTTGDGRVDQWWTWSGDNVTIAVDTNGDGQPDPTSQLTLDKTGQAVGSSTADNGSPPPVASSAAPAASSAAAPAASSAAPAASSASTASTDGGKP